MKKRSESWQLSHVKAFFRVAQLQKANHGIRQYRATVKWRSVRIPLIINIPGESLCYSLFWSILIKHMLQWQSTEGNSGEREQGYFFPALLNWTLYKSLMQL